MTFNDNNNHLTNMVFADDYQTTVNPLYTSGKVGVFAFQSQLGAPDATFDNFQANAAFPSATISAATGTATVSWPAHQDGIWVLESSSTLGGPWTEIPFASITFSNGQFVYSESTDTGNDFFRLRKI